MLKHNHLQILVTSKWEVVSDTHYLSTESTLKIQQYVATLSEGVFVKAMTMIKNTASK